MHSNSRLGVLMAMTRAAVACLNLTYACDTHDARQMVKVGWRVAVSGSSTARWGSEQAGA